MLWIKAFHIIAVVTWFAALFYLPRLFVYHSMSEDETSRERFKIMERKLYRGIATPSMVVVILLGAWMSYLNWAWYSQTGWYWCKLILVAILMGYHHACAVYMRQLKEDRCRKSHVFFRWFNEFPVLLLVGIILLVVVKPF
ncbi:protoporphyrinogen oxidase HemJ [Cellvibrio polysaccharolyticus]|uniref:Protoporphyrinogen IX oxidase n=1 Tax=Cellvibrio polysaccharolyticus TaxID=2082724 RepID=A0A928V8I1_9GAMM|nr:protoporphyrinogen oxidase HemJ [Cellvibrio polysaccharolyticus]MBE8718449.1 protoporphyrinogen oxidase HemJ [Cellvibrio polysaccharolyticus]